MRAPLPDLDALDIEALKTFILYNTKRSSGSWKNWTGKGPHWTSSGLSIRTSYGSDPSRLNT